MAAVTSQATNSQDNPLAGFGPNEWIVEDMYQRYLADPTSVDPAWHDFFADYRPVLDTGLPQATRPGEPTAAAPGTIRGDDRGNRVVGTDLEELWRELLALSDMDGLDGIRQSQFLEQDGNLVAVWCRPEIQRYQAVPPATECCLNCSNARLASMHCPRRSET